MRITINESEYFSLGDERRFYECINEVKAIKKIHGQKDELFLEITVKQINSNNFRDLLALFYRYSIPLKTLKPLAIKKQFKWLNNAQGYWHRDLNMPSK